MKKICSRILIVFILASVFITGFAAAGYADSAYTTEEYDVNVNVDESSSYIITETITVHFPSSQHGIFRYIPTDGVKIDRVNVEDYEYEVYTENGNKVIKIGSEDLELRGSNTYRISYRMRVFDDKDTSKDFFYLDLIPTGWDSPIDKASCTINMPKSFNDNKLQVYSGTYGEDSSNKTSYRTDGNTITVTAAGLKAYEGVTVRMDLNEGYWVDPINYDYMKWIIPFVLILVPLIMIALWAAFGRDPKIVETVEFYPPEKMTPAEIGYIIDGTIDQKDMTSMIMYYADRGYLKVAEYKKNKIMLTKLRDIEDTEKSFAKTMFEGLFAKSDEVKLDDLGEEFGEKYLTAREQLADYYKVKDRKLFTVKSKVFRVAGNFIMCLPAVIAVICAAFYGLKMILSLVAVPAGLLIIGGGLVITCSFDRMYVLSKGKKVARYLTGFILLLAGAAIGAGFVWYMISMAYGIGVFVSMVVTLIPVMLMKARTEKSAQWLGKILGLKRFIKSAELPKLEKLVYENPDYFYNILPYAYVMALSDKWAKNFNRIDIKAPEWYSSSTDNTLFNVWMFNSLMRNSCNSAANHIVSTLPDSGGGADFSSFGGGGGFSGGGFGGGGGGAW